MANILKVGGGTSKYKEVGEATFHYNQYNGYKGSEIIVKNDGTILIHDKNALIGDYMRTNTYTNVNGYIDFYAVKSGYFHVIKYNMSTKQSEETKYVQANAQICRVQGGLSDCGYACVVAL